MELSIIRVVFVTLQITVLSLIVNGSRSQGQTNGNHHQEKFGQRFAMEPQDQTAIVGSRVTLPCRVVAKSGTLQWTKDDFALGQHRNLSGYERYSMVGSDEEGDFSLDIYPVMLDDDAVYQCQVSPGGGSKMIRSRFAQLSVLVPPDNPRITQGSHIMTTEDREIELECVSKGGKPPAEITWIDGLGNVISKGIEYMHQQLDNSKLFEARSILKFTPKKEHHNTTFSCQAQNTADRTYKSARLRLEVKFAPKVNVEVISGALVGGRIAEGTEVRLACKAEANPNDLSYRWFMNDEKIIGDHSTELIIPNINRSFHDSIVKCEVNNIVGKSEDSETLDISYGPSFKVRPRSMEADVGSVVTLVCDVDGNPTPEIVWIYDALDRVVGTSPNLTLTVNQETIGRYFCKATVNGFPEIGEQATVYLKGPPAITSTKRQFGIPGDTSRIECIAFSIPKARHVSWTYNGMSINSSSDENFSVLEDPLPYGIKSTLVIRESGTKHFGRYNCTVINDYGYDVLEIELNGESRYNSQLFFICFGAAISFIFLIMFILTMLMCMKKTKKKLPPADVIPNEHNFSGKGCKESDCSSNKSDMKINRENEYLETELSATRIPMNTFGMPLAGPVSIPNDFRYSGDFTDSFGHIQTTKLGVNNNGYIPYVDYNRDYTPPPQHSLTLNHQHSKPMHTTSLANHLIIGTSTTTPTITSASIVGITPGGIANGTYSLTRNRAEMRLENGLPMSMSSIPNGLMNQSLLNIDPRYSAAYGNPYLKQSNGHVPSNAAHSTLTPAPPPYQQSRGSNSNSSFSSSTTISNLNGGGGGGGGSIMGIGVSLNSANTSQTPSPSAGQFILPANQKVGALATHV